MKGSDASRRPKADRTRNWPARERPRERLIAEGAKRLTDAELLAIVPVLNVAKVAQIQAPCRRALGVPTTRTIIGQATRWPLSIDTSPTRATIIETFGNGDAMAIVTYSVPDEVKAQFNRAFARENKSTVIARLMMQAVEEHRVQKARARAIDSILRRRRNQKPVSNSQIRAARVAGRP